MQSGADGSGTTIHPVTFGRLPAAGLGHAARLIAGDQQCATGDAGCTGD
jgi:hypothetical protein